MPISGKLTHFVLDCIDPDRLATFWTGVLGVEVASRWKQYVILEPMAEGQPGLVFQKVPEPKSAKNRLHLDFTVRDLEGATAIVTDLGGSIVEENVEEGVTARVMADPEGNEFCFVHFTAPSSGDGSPSEHGS